MQLLVYVYPRITAHLMSRLPFWVVAYISLRGSCDKFYCLVRFATVNDAKSTIGASTPRRTLRTLETKFHTKRAVIRIVPISASNAAFLSVMVGV